MPKLFENYRCEFETDSKLFYDFVERNRKLVFTNNYDYDTQSPLSLEEKSKLKALGANMSSIYRYQYFLYNGDNIIGWSYGMQHSAGEVYMTNTGIFKEFRGKGIYQAFLKELVKDLSDKGFQRIFSRHKFSNNQILVPKLKAGFIITGTQVDEQFGNLVTLSYYTNPVRKKIIETRIGMQRPDEQTNSLIIV